jgi:hypothetical protein
MQTSEAVEATCGSALRPGTDGMHNDNGQLWFKLKAW